MNISFAKQIDAHKKQVLKRLAIASANQLNVNALVTFFNPDEAIAAVGFVEETGNFTIKPAEKETGRPAGKYQVTITPPPPPPMTEAEYKKMEANAMATPQTTYKELPAKFFSSMTSGLVFDVKPGPNSFDIDLSK